LRLGASVILWLIVVNPASQHWAPEPRRGLPTGSGVIEQIDKLADGTPCQIGLCLLDGEHQDRECVKAEIDAAVRRMSPESRRLRFASALNRLSDAQLDYLTDFDRHNRIAWCAFDASGDKHVGVGLARLMRLPTEPGEPGVAEFAVTVVDAYQRRGLGTLLLDRLIGSAREQGISVVRGYVLPENEAMLRLGKRFGASVAREESFVRLEIAV
jgi:RimJ/RimL family protein N-acetyltransferase